MPNSRNLSVFPSTKSNSALHWNDVQNPVRTAFHWCCISLAGWFPSMRVRRFLLRVTGMRVGKNVSIGLNAQFDIFFPEKITLEENCIVGWDCLILCHEFLHQEYRVGTVRVGKNAVIGARSTILPGIVVGDNALVGAMSLVNRDVKIGDWVGGVPIQPLRK